MKTQQHMDLESMEVYHSFWDHYLNGDVEEVISLLGHNYTQVGSTEAEDFFRKKDAVRFLQDTIDQVAGKVEMRNRSIRYQHLDHFVLIHERCDIYVLRESDWGFYAKFRASTLMEQQNQEWKIIHRHSSFPVSKTREGQSISIEKTTLENQQLRNLVNQRTAELEQKNRELEIEAALDRIRTKAVTMKQSSDMNRIFSKIFEELRSLNREFIQSCILIFIPEEKSFTWWTANPEAADEIFHFRIPFLDHPAFHAFMKAWMERKSRFYYQLSGELKKSWENLLFYKTDLRRLPIAMKRNMMAPDQVHLYESFSEFGVLFVTCNEPLSEEKFSVLERFGAVFEQAYTRFKDIQQAETREKEATRQSSLDRLRAEIASMRNSTDLNRITPLIWRELRILGVPFFRCGVFIINEKDKKIQVYLSSPEGHSLGVLNLVFNSNQLTTKAVDFWKKNKIYRQHWNKVDFTNWLASMIELGQVQNPETYQGAASPPESLDLHFVPFSQGMLYIGNSAPLSESELELVKSLAESFSIAYARYQDFEQLEEAKTKVEKTLSDLKAAQNQLIQSEKMASLGQLTAGIAHEIKNPLNFVKNFSELSLELVNEAAALLEKENKIESIKLAFEILRDVRTNLSKVNEHSKRADEIINSMLQHSRSGSGKRILTDFNHLIKEAALLSYHGMKAGKKPFPVEIDFELDNQIGEIPVFAEELSMATINLCNNAWDAMREKLIALSLQSKNKTYSPKLLIKTRKDPRSLLFSIQDNGSGIPEDIKDKILQPFFTTKKGTEGTGLGLSITNDIVKAHGGELKIKSEEGVGTEFTILLPLKS
ncbi:ATP-binding protein [Algoriphagus lacus]|nr:ATP-binding protein [Algoriphagus lacus]